MKNAKLIVSAVVLLVFIGCGVWAYTHVSFSVASLRLQLAAADWRRILLALGCIYLGYVLRGVRWALLLRPNKRVGLFSLIGTQVIGFTSIALIGRVADLTRPYLVSRKTGVPLSTQIAVYIVERLFDAGSMALIFSSVILLSPKDALPHPEVFHKVGYWGLTGTIAGALFLVLVRVAGPAVAAFSEHAISLLSRDFGHSVGAKIRGFHAGLDTLRTPLDVVVTLSISLAMWGLITLAYLETTRAFTASPELAGMTLAKCMVLLVVSGGASALQLPIIGWFTQIGLVAAAMSRLFAVAAEPATACAATILLVTFLGIVPVGLIWAQVEHVSLRSVTAASEQAAVEAEDSLEQAEQS